MEAILKNLAEVTEALNQTVRENRARSSRHARSTSTTSPTNGGPELQQDSRERAGRSPRTCNDALWRRAARTGSSAARSARRSTKVNRASDRISRARSSTSTRSPARIDRGEGTIGKLTKDEKLINEVEGVVEEVSDFVGGIYAACRRSSGLRTDYNFLANTIKSYVELRLQPREDKYYLIELINDPRGQTSFEQTDVDTTNPNDAAALPRSAHRRPRNAFRFSLQFAQTLRSVHRPFRHQGVDGRHRPRHCTCFDNRFELRQDLFGFGEELQPRWRVSLGYEFIQRLWLLGGVDDIFYATRRDYFVGPAAPLQRSGPEGDPAVRLASSA